MKLIFQIAAGIVLGGAILLGATGLIAEHLSLQISQQVVQGLGRITQLQEQQLAFYQEQLNYLEAQQARISTEIQMARVELRERLLNRPESPASPTPMIPEMPPSIDAEPRVIARGGNAGSAPDTLANPASDPAGPAELRRKEEAWGRFYSKPDDCGFIADQATMVRCGNDHIVKRREFEQLWDQGMIE